MAGRTARRRVLRVTLPQDGTADGPAVAVRADARADLLAAEEPLGIRVDGTALTMTMRTPGDDVELAAGFLVGEAIVSGRDDIAAIKVCDGTTCGHRDHSRRRDREHRRRRPSRPAWRWRPARGGTS